MIDAAKVAEALECFRMHPNPRECEKKDCPYNNNDPHYGYWCCSNRLLFDAVRLLKAMDFIPLINVSEAVKNLTKPVTLSATDWEGVNCE